MGVDDNGVKSGGRGDGALGGGDGESNMIIDGDDLWADDPLEGGGSGIREKKVKRLEPSRWK